MKRLTREDERRRKVAAAWLYARSFEDAQRFLRENHSARVTVNRFLRELDAKPNLRRESMTRRAIEQRAWNIVKDSLAKPKKGAKK